MKKTLIISALTALSLVSKTQEVVIKGIFLHESMGDRITLLHDFSLFGGSPPLVGISDFAQTARLFQENVDALFRREVRF